MKPIRIDFVPQHRWLVFWSFICIAAGVGAGAFYVKQRSADAAARSLEATTSKANAQALEIRQSAQHSTDQNRLAADLSLSKSAQGHLQLDWNPAFATIENVAEPGARLLQFSIDAVSGNVRLEYEVESLGQAAVLTSLMNAGMPASPWRLESVSASSVTGGPQKMRAAWSAKLKELR